MLEQQDQEVYVKRGGFRLKTKIVFHTPTHMHALLEPARWSNNMNIIFQKEDNGA